MGDTGRIPALDGLRGVAIVAVVLAHAWLLPGGFHGVTVFFVLSGYLITGLLLREHDRDGRVDLRRFYLRRSARIFPALVVAVTMLAAMTPDSLFRWAASVGQVGNLVVTFAGDGVLMDGFSWTWSLAMEEQFYLVWPAVLVALLVRGRRDVAFRVAVAVWAASSVGGVIVGALGDETTAYYAPWLRVDGLAAGCAVALWSQHRDVRASRPVALLAAVVLGGCFATAAFTPTEPLVVAASAVLLLHGAALPGLALWPLRHLGRISYGLYLWHATLLATGNWDVLFPNRWTWMLASLVAAEASWWGLERPILRRVASADLRHGERAHAKVGVPVRG